MTTESVVKPKVGVFGVRHHWGCDHVGQERAPEFLRQAGLFKGKKDYGDLVFPHYNKDIPIKVQNRTERILLEGNRPLMIGGDHSVTYGVVKGLLKQLKNFGGIIWVDAHTDFDDRKEDAFGNVFGLGHANVLYLLSKVVPKERICVIGATRMRDYAVRNNILMLNPKDYNRAISRVTNDGELGFYLSCDIDALKRKFAPSTFYNNNGCMTLEEMTTICRESAKSGLMVGSDLVEISPTRDDEKDKRTMESAKEIIEAMI